MLQAGNPGKSRDVCDHPALFLTNNHAILKCLLASYSTVIFLNGVAIDKRLFFYNSVRVAVWSLFGKELLTRLTICSFVF